MMSTIWSTVQWILSIPGLTPQLNLGQPAAADIATSWGYSAQSLREPLQVSVRSAVASSGSCCEALQKILRDEAVLPDSERYTHSADSYWSLKNTEIHPSCILLPQTVQDVSLAVSTLSLGATVWTGKCQFAIKSGGHNPYIGAANIQQGIVIDLGNLPSQGLAQDKKTFTIAPSKKWDQVYAELDEHGLSTLGGRVGGVGVGGLVLGCGISYFSARYGFACDVAENFEAVLTSGEIVNANATHNTDLFKALRGGGNNFAVVTAITLRTFPQGAFWGGQSFHTIDTRQEHFKAHERLINSNPYDVYSHFINSIVITNLTRTWFIGDSLQYTKSDPPQPFPEVFKPFTDIERIPIFPGGPDNTFRIDNVTSFSMEYAALSTYKKRWLFATIAFGNSAQMMEDFFQIANKTIQPLIQLPGFALTISYQPMPTVMSQRYGAVDSLGPIQTEGHMFYIHWAMAVDGSGNSTDKLFEDTTKAVFSEAKEVAKKSGLARDYIPPTYSDRWQDPIRSRSKATVEELIAISKKYDPARILQRQVPGGHKLPL